ncbi:MAG: hypothetical protein V2B14_04100 [bacterium]
MEFQRALEITTLALDGLSQRHKLLAANVANAETPEYKRVDLKFEDQLVKIIKNDDKKESKRNSMGMKYIPNSVPSYVRDEIESSADTADTNNSEKTKKNTVETFKPEIISTNDESIKSNGNNVNIEYEMAELAKNGMKYTVIAQLQEKLFKGLSDIVRGGGV